MKAKIFCYVLLYVVQRQALVTAFILRENSQSSYLSRWKDLGKVIYDGHSVQELLDKCPNGCTEDCTFKEEAPTRGGQRKEVPCATALSPGEPEPDEIVVLRRAQKLVQEWQELVRDAKSHLILHGTMVGIIAFLILILVCMGHYRIRDLWFLPAERKWELEKDPTWGLPGKVWSLLRVRVVKSSKKEPTERKYVSYTDNPTVMGDKFWTYKQSIRQMYKQHKYYKRNRYFHKMAWQITKLGKVIPATLRPTKVDKRRPGEMAVLNPSKTSIGDDPQVQLPWEIDLADELNQLYLQKAKEKLKEAVDKEKELGYFINGRFQPPVQIIQQRKRRETSGHPDLQPLLTKGEVVTAAKKLANDPTADYVNVEGVMKPLPFMKDQVAHERHKHHHHHHHQNQNFTQQELEMMRNFLRKQQDEQEGGKTENVDKKTEQHLGVGGPSGLSGSQVSRAASQASLNPKNANAKKKFQT